MDISIEERTHSIYQLLNLLTIPVDIKFDIEAIVALALSVQILRQFSSSLVSVSEFMASSFFIRRAHCRTTGLESKILRFQLRQERR
jgi:hypothetical protein